MAFLTVYDPPRLAYQMGPMNVYSTRLSTAQVFIAQVLPSDILLRRRLSLDASVSGEESRKDLSSLSGPPKFMLFLAFDTQASSDLIRRVLNYLAYPRRWHAHKRSCLRPRRSRPIFCNGPKDLTPSRRIMPIEKGSRGHGLDERNQ